VADFYAGKTITIIVGYAPGGGYDTTARVLSKHLGSHIPGNPNVVVENMDGAGSLLAANHLYNVDKPDGLTLGAFNELQIVNQVTGMDGVQFDARKFSWIGSAQQTTWSCIVRADSPYKTGQDFTRKDLPPLILGGTAPGASTDDFPKLLNALAGANIKLVSGYTGSNTIKLAVDSHEVDGLCFDFESLPIVGNDWLQNKSVNVPLYESRDGKSDAILKQFPNAVSAEDLISDPTSKQLLRAATAPTAMSKPLAAPPGVPADRLQALRDAYTATLNDPAFQADATTARLTIVPHTGQQVEQTVSDVLSLDPAMGKRLADIRA
jgi:tripartite-type tricarboxylate transporter receptor subunit TctC